MGPLSGYLSDRFGARFFSTGGMLLTAVGFAGLMLLPPDFYFPAFAVIIFVIGMGMGMFAAPNTTAIMNSVPAEHRGVSSGMRSTFQNTANTLSITLIFTMVTAGLAVRLPAALYSGLTQAGLPGSAAQGIAELPPTAALFAAFLGYNPLGTLLPSQLLHSLPAAAQAQLLSKTFFPSLIAEPFEQGLRIAFFDLGCAVDPGGARLVAARQALHSRTGGIARAESHRRAVAGRGVNEVTREARTNARLSRGTILICRSCFNVTLDLAPHLPPPFSFGKWGRQVGAILPSSRRGCPPRWLGAGEKSTQSMIPCKVY